MALVAGETDVPMSVNEDGRYAVTRDEMIAQARTAGFLSALPGGTFDSLTGTANLSGGFSDVSSFGGLVGAELGEMNGSFGVGGAGFGPGGGGTGWGTIAAGGYSTIGHGSGYGSCGCGSIRDLRGRESVAPTVIIDAANVTGSYDKSIIRRYIRRHLSKFSYCYEKELLANPALSGTVTAVFVIAPNGRVASATADGADPEVASCVADVVKAIEFPKLERGESVKVTYPFIFELAGS
jgi:hypothetical protein